MYIAILIRFIFLLDSGYLKSVIAQAIGLKPEKLKLIFRGIEREDHEDILSAGIMDNSEVLVTEDTTCKQNYPEQVPQICVPSKGETTVAEVRKEVDKLEQQVYLIWQLIFPPSFCSWFLEIFMVLHMAVI